MQKSVNVQGNKSILAVMVCLVVLGIAGAAMAFMNPTTTTDVGYDLWDLVVNKFIKGPIGAAAGTAMVVVGAIGAAMGKLSAAAWPLVAGGILVGAPGIATSLGMLF